MKQGKWLVLLGACALSLPVFAAEKKALVDEMSGQGYGMAGCGLGSIVFGSKPGMVQVVAATLNGIYGNQTFGITSGTSNCADSGGGKKAEVFIEANRVALENDIARGSGENLSSLSAIYGCSNPEAFNQKMQSSYTRIFPSKAAPATEIRDAISETIREDSALSSSCATII